jgi:predicted Rossmann-fold nucleotide-binding protein
VRADKIVVTLDAFQQAWPELTGAAVVELDLRHASLDPLVAHVDGALFLGCTFAPGVADQLATRGAVNLPAFAGLPFKVYRSELYTADELTAGHHSGGAATLDERITRWFEASSATALPDLLVRALHDATIDAAVARFVVGRRVVGIMGGHALPRDDAMFRAVAVLARELARHGLTVATGGGPGVMEAANLGAWCAPLGDEVLDTALSMLGELPRYPEDPAGYVRRGLEVRDRWGVGGESLGVPTWVYAEEPTGCFASHIAKYFTNSVREDGLLAIARSGVVYAPGGAGTEQEIFTDTAQNSLTLYGVRSPMVFFGARHFEDAHPELLSGARRQAAAFGWDDLIAVLDEPADVVRFIEEHDPDRDRTFGVERRRTHRGAPRPTDTGDQTRR